MTTESYYKSFVKSVDRICSGHFLSPISIEKRHKILRSSLTMVELEVSSFCNRKCSFCPNSFIDRFSNKNFMNQDVYENIIQQLASFNYSGKLGFVRYSEPFADNGIISKIAYAKNILPNMTILVITNGDYLNYKYVNDMEKVGLDEVRVSIYLKDGQEFTEENIAQCIDKIEDKIGRRLELIHKYDGKFVTKSEKRGGRLPHFSILAQNFNVRGTNRGGLISGKSITHRISPCHQPFSNIIIDYNGNVVPCCNIRSDAPEHVDYILGNINKDTLSDIYFSEKAMAWRRELYHFSDKRPPCNSCSMSEYDDSEWARNYLDKSLAMSHYDILKDNNDVINPVFLSDLKEKKMLHANNDLTKSERYMAFLVMQLAYLQSVSPQGCKNSRWCDALEWSMTELGEGNRGGLCLEFGVHKGNSLRRCAARHPSRTFYGFDSFEGFPNDSRCDWKQDFSVDSLPDVPENCCLIKGWFKDTLPVFLANHLGEIDFINIDCDLYSSTVDIFTALEQANRLRSGIVCHLDEAINYKDYLWNEMLSLFEMLERTKLGISWIGTPSKVRPLEETLNLLAQGAYPSISEDSQNGYWVRSALVLTDDPLDYGPLHRQHYRDHIRNMAREFDRLTAKRG